MNLILGITECDNGKIIFDGEDLTSVPMEKEGLILFFRTMPCSPTIMYKNQSAN